MSDKIRVISVIGRFLEHSRIFFFQNGKDNLLDGDFFIGSADWMYRNLLARVETVVPIEELPLKERLWEVFDVMLNDRRSAWEMQPDGSYIQYKPKSSAEEAGTQQKLMELTRARHAAAVKAAELEDET